MRPGLPLVALVATVSAPLPAEEPAAAFGAGLEHLAGLGLPPMQGAEWVRLPKDLAERENFLSSYEFRKLGVRLEGGAWKLPGETPRFLGFAGTEIHQPPAEEKPEPEEKKSPGLLGKMLKNYAAEKPAAVPAAKKKGIPVEEDVRLLVEALEKEKVREEFLEQIEYGSAELPGRCLVFAAQLHAAGKKAEGSRLAAAIFAAVPSPEPVIDAAVSQFASAGYQAAASAFFTDYDWQRYLEAAKALLAKYPRGWRDAGAVAMLVPLLEKRAAGVQPAPLALPGVELSPAAVEALDALLVPQDAGSGADDEALARSHGVDLSDVPAEHRAQYLAMLRQHGMGGESGTGLWLLEGGEKEQPPRDPVGKIKAMGMDGLIALAAAATDETLVPVRNSGGRSSYFYRGSSQSAEEIAAGTFKTMTRPQTRGELAAGLLAAALPLGEDREEMDSVSLRDLAVEFWKKHRGKSGVELALVFLKEGDTGQVDEAAEYLAGHESPAARQAFEKAVLSAENPVAFAGAVESYLEKRKGQARPFLASYTAALRKALEDVDPEDMGYSSGYYVLREAGGVEKYLKKLSVKIGDVSLKDTVAAAVATGKAEEISALAGMFGSAGMPEILAVTGEAAGEAPPELRVELFQLVLSSVFGNRGEEEPDPPAELELPAGTLAIWKSLLAGTEALPAGSNFGGWLEGYGAKTTGDAAALVLEVAAFPGSGENFNPFGDIHESLGAVAPFARQRAEALVEGKEPPPWPDQEKVPEDRQKEIAAKLASLPAGELLPYARSLPPEERLFLASTVRAYGEENPAPPGVTALRRTVVARRGYNPAAPHDPAILDRWGIREGFVLSADGLAGMAEKMAREAEEHSGTTVLFYPGPMGLGCTATAFRNPEKESRWEYYLTSLARWFGQYEDAEALSMLAAGRTADLWSAKDGKTVKLESPNPIKDSLEGLLVSGDGSVPLHLSIQVLTRADAEKLKNE